MSVHRSLVMLDGVLWIPGVLLPRWGAVVSWGALARLLWAGSRPAEAAGQPQVPSLSS